MSLQIKVARIQTQGSGRVMPGIGDPGLGSFLANTVRGAIGFVRDPVGTIASVLGGALGGQPGVVSNGQVVTKFKNIQAQPPGPNGGILDINPPFGGEKGFGFTAFGGKGGGGTGGGMAANGNGCMSGFHPNKSSYFLQNGTFIQKGTKCVKNRRRNSLNPRALDRAIGRIVGAKKKEETIKRITVRPKKCPK